MRVAEESTRLHKLNISPEKLRTGSTRNTADQLRISRNSVEETRDNVEFVNSVMFVTSCYVNLVCIFSSESVYLFLVLLLRLLLH